MLQKNTWSEILPSLTGGNDFTKGNIIQSFLESPKSSEITSDDVIEIIKKAEIENDSAKGNIILGFLKSSHSSIKTSDDVIKIIKDAKIEYDVAKGNIIRGFLKSSHSSIKTSDDVIKIIKDAKIENDLAKGDIIQGFLESSQSSVKTSDDVIEIIKKAEIKNYVAKGNIIQGFLKSSQSSVKTSDDVIKIIKDADIKDDSAKENIIVEFLESERSLGINVEGFVKMIKSAEFNEDRSKERLIDNFLKSEGSSGINVEDFVKMIKSAEFKEDWSKERLINDFLKSERSPNMTPQDLANMMKEVGLQNRSDLSTDLYITKFSASENYVKNFIDFTKALQPREAMQFEFVNEFINKNQINQGNLKGLKPFIERLQDNELALDLINNLSMRRMLVNAKDTLSLVKNRSKKQYTFLTKIVGDKDLSDCISVSGIGTLKATFGADLKINEKPISVSDLISYFDIQNQASLLSAMLKPEFKTELQNNFSPSADKLLYKPQELEKLNQLLCLGGVTFDVKSYFVENTKLCDYLKDKVGDIKEVDSNTADQINFTNFGIEEHKQAEINTLFNELLKADNPDAEKVKKFFFDLLKVDIDGFDNPDNSEKLKSFFEINKKELAHCFCNKNLSVDILLRHLKDGCASNIGTHFKKALYATMIKDENEESKILYSFADKEIISAIINNHGEDIMVGNFDPLNSDVVRSYLLSPMALVKKLSEEKMLTNQISWDIIGKIAGEDKRDAIADGLKPYSDNTEMYNKKAKEIVSFLIIEQVVGKEEMSKLESKNPQLKELGGLIYNRPQQESSPQPPQIAQQDDPPATRVGCINFSSIFSCLRSSRS